MKADNILDSNLKRKSIIVYDFFAKLGFLTIFSSFFYAKKKFKRKFFKTFLYNPYFHDGHLV